MANQFLTTTELDFETLKAALKDYMRSQRAFQDYNFEGSNLGFLIDLLTYNTHVNGQYLNMVGSEMFLDTAVMRESIVSQAKELNYVPRSKTSSRIPVTITITPGDSPDTITVPARYPIYSTIDNTTYTFTNIDPIIIKNSGGSYVSDETIFYEGEIVTEVFTAAPTFNDSGDIQTLIYPISSSNVDISSIKVNVQTSTTDTSNTNWARKSSLFGLTSASEIFFVEGYRANNYQLVFGNDVIGKALKQGNIVRITYRDTVGSGANGASIFTKSGDIEGYSSISVTANGSSYGGAERESDSDVRYNAPRHFQTQERAVTAEDYITLVKTNFPEVQAVVAYGGEEEEVPLYGKVIISVKPNGVVGNISTSLKNQIRDFLKLKSLTTEPVIKDPEFFYIEVVSETFYDPSLTTLSQATIKSKVVNAITSYATNNLTTFNKDVRYSKVVGSIDNADGSIVSNDTRLRIIKRWSPLTGTETDQTLSFSFGQSLNYDTDVPALESGNFIFTDSTGSQYTSAYFKDDGLGTVKIMTMDDGEEIILKSSAGTVDYTTGTIYLSAIFDGYTGPSIKIYAYTEEKDILSSKNQFLIVDSNDITVTMSQYLD